MFTIMFKKFREKKVFVNELLILIAFFSVMLLACRKAYGIQQITQFGITWTFDREYPMTSIRSFKA